MTIRNTLVGLFILTLGFNYVIAETLSADEQTKRQDFRNAMSIEKLDILKTCTTPEKIKAANQSITWILDFRWWNVAGHMASIHPDLKIWHSSWANSWPNFEKQKPAYKDGKLTIPTVVDDKKTNLVMRFPPMTKGVSNYNLYVETLAYIAYTNNIGDYDITPSKIECLSDTEVIATTRFKGYSVIRDEFGYIVYGAPIDVPTRVYVSFKKDTSGNSLISELKFDLADATGDQAFYELGKLIKGQKSNAQAMSNIDTTKAATYEQILEDFKRKAAVLDQQ